MSGLRSVCAGVRMGGARDDAGAAALERELRSLIDDFNVTIDGTVVIPSAYLEVIALRH